MLHLKRSIKGGRWCAFLQRMLSFDIYILGVIFREDFQILSSVATVNVFCIYRQHVEIFVSISTFMCFKKNNFKDSEEISEFSLKSIPTSLYLKCQTRFDHVIIFTLALWVILFHLYSHLSTDPPTPTTKRPLISPSHLLPGFSFNHCHCCPYLLPLSLFSSHLPHFYPPPPSLFPSNLSLRLYV